MTLCYTNCGYGGLIFMAINVIFVVATYLITKSYYKVSR